jgi:hypothetical protein
MPIEMNLAGIKKYVTESQVRLFEAIGWKKAPGADQGPQEIKTPEASPTTKKPRTPRKAK